MMRMNLPDDDLKHSTKFVSECKMPTDRGDYRMRAYDYRSSTRKLEPIVMISGDIRDKENVLLRVHDQCFTSEVFGSKRCDCREQLRESLDLIQREGGVLIYLQQEGRGIGIANKVAAYGLQDQGMDTVEANIHLGFEDEMREYEAVPDILKDLSVQSIRLLTNNPYKIEQLSRVGVNITERVAIEIPSTPYNERYLRSKKEKMNHLLSEETIVNIMNTAAETTTATTTATTAVVAPSKEVSPADGSNSRDGSIAAANILRRGKHTKSWPAPRVKAQESPQRHHQQQQQQQYVRASAAAASTAAVGHLSGGSSNSSSSSSSSSSSHTNSNNISDSSIHSSSSSASDSGAGDAKSSSPGYAFGKSSVEAAISAVKQGQVVLVVDDADRENEGDFIMAAEKATAEAVGFIVRYSSGVLCVSLENERLQRLHLPPMVAHNQDPKQTAYSISVDHKNTSTGISAYDRALTFRELVNPLAQPSDFHRPGHVFPLRYKPGGVVARAGHTEASLDLSRLAGLRSGAVLAEVVHDDGSMMRLQGLEQFAQTHGLVLTSVQDIVAYRMETEGIVDVPAYW